VIKTAGSMMDIAIFGRMIYWATGFRISSIIPLVIAADCNLFVWKILSANNFSRILVNFATWEISGEMLNEVDRNCRNSMMGT